MEKLVAKIYAQALFDVAIESNMLDKFNEELNFINETFVQYPDLYTLYKTPRIDTDDKKEIIARIFQNGISKEVLNFSKILLDKGRASSFEDIVKEYKRFVNAHNNIIEAVAITAIPMQDMEKVALENKLSNLTGKVVRLENKIDNSILGGILVRIGDKVIDGTIQSRLNQLQENLVKIIV
jgi:F-type H+-transporting ATPase subunit delta